MCNYCKVLYLFMNLLFFFLCWSDSHLSIHCGELMVNFTSVFVFEKIAVGKHSRSVVHRNAQIKEKTSFITPSTSHKPLIQIIFLKRSLEAYSALGGQYIAIA